MNRNKIYSPEKDKYVGIHTKHGKMVLQKYKEHRKGGDKHKGCAYSKIRNIKTGKMVSTYGQTGGRVIKEYCQIGGDNYFIDLSFFQNLLHIVYIRKKMNNFPEIHHYHYH